VKIDGKVHEVRSTLWRARGRCRVEWDPVEERMRARDMIRDGKVGQAEVHLMRGSDVDAVTEALCREVCPQCSIEPDWSNERAVE
jgi:hypothetical protein